MKKLIVFTLLLIVALTLSGCNNRNMDDIIQTEPNITGIVKTINNDVFLMENEEGEYWVSLNVENKDSMTYCSTGDEVVVYFDGNVAESYPMHDFEDEFFAYTKPSLMDAEMLYQVRVSNKDIDTNVHLNNQKSAEMLMDALPFDFFFTDMNVYYKKAAVLGDILELCSCKTENGYYVHLQTPEKDVCVAGIFEFNK